MTSIPTDGNVNTVPSSPSADAELTATKLTNERGDIYGTPDTNLECIGELKEVYRKYSVCKTLAHEEAIECILMKIGRIATGNYHADNYNDIMGYAKIARDLGEIPF